MSDPTLDFGPDLDHVRRRVADLSYFNSVTDLQAATVAIVEMNALPPAAFVSIASETAEPNKLVTTISQRVNVTISTLFCVPVERASGCAGDEMDETRRAVIRILLGFTPDRAEKPLEYDRFLLRVSEDGLIWGEVLMRTCYRLGLA